MKKRKQIAIVTAAIILLLWAIYRFKCGVLVAKVELHAQESREGALPVSIIKPVGTATEIIPRKLLLIGIFTTPEKSARRNLIRQTYLLEKPGEFDHVFVFGKPASKADYALLVFEKATFNDIMILDCDENMNNGKTVEYFRHLVVQKIEYPFSIHE